MYNYSIFIKKDTLAKNYKVNILFKNLFKPHKALRICAKFEVLCIHPSEVQ